MVLVALQRDNILPSLYKPCYPQLPPEATMADNANASTVDAKAFTSFAAFYPFYLSGHNNRTCRRPLHFVGSSLGLVCWRWPSCCASRGGWRWGCRWAMPSHG